MLLKKILLLLFIITIASQFSMAQTKNDYAKNWKKVEDLEKKGLTKSALQEVLAIYKLAIKDNNDAQQIKTSIYQITYRNMIEEDSYEKNIFFVDTLIAKAKFPVKNILQSMQAEMFWRYLQNNMWRIRDQTKLQEENSKDIATWSLDKLYSKVSALYIASMSNDNLLKSIKLDGFEAIIIKGENTRQLRPTLFDFLGHRALNFFVTGESYLTKPAYQFEIDDMKAFAPAEEFVKYRFETKDTVSLHYKAILLFQNILSFHLTDAKPDALIDVDLIRLNFINQYAINENKVKLYDEALQNIEQKYADNPQATQASYLRADMYFRKASNLYTKPEPQYDIKKAKEICDKAISKFPKSEGGINCRNLLNEILEPSLKIESEQVNVPNQPFRNLVKYKNVKTVYFRIISIKRNEIKKLGYNEYDEKHWKNIVDLKYIKSWSENLPNPGDYREHSVEIKVDGLPAGSYFLLASLDEEFSLKKNIISQQLVDVSNISYINNNNKEFYVLNRDNGLPLAGTQVQIWENKYNYTKGAYEEIKAEKYVTDKNGLFTIKKSDIQRNILLQLKYNTEELFLDNDHYDYNYNTYINPVTPTTFLFTDRSIYRPGQTVYFKGIVLQNGIESSSKKILTSFVSEVQLLDANGQKVSGLTMTTNEYGSYHGSFKLPESGLTGQFSLQDMKTHSTQYFNVEEYKRPKFFVEVQKPKGTYRVNDSITVTGTAKAYAGNNIDGAKVSYRVVRKVRYPIWWEYGYIRKGPGRFPPYGRNEEMTITFGEAVTDPNGAFTVTFKAIPDNSVDKRSQPTFNYEVSADVTDINGETRSAGTSVAVANQALQLNIFAADKLPADSIKNIQISSTNINDIFEKATINLSVYKLQSPDKIFRERYWQQPDQFIMSKEQYYSLFPYDIYNDEDQISKWEIKEKVLDITDTTSENYKFNIQGTKLLAGWYKIIATTKDKYGEDVKAEKYIQLTDEESITDKNPITINAPKKSAEPGEKIKYEIKTGFQNIWLIQTISKADKNNTPFYLTIKNNQPYQNEFVVTENDRGGIGFNYAFVKHNRVYTSSESFVVPWNNKDLNIFYSTFRDKLLPGEKEKWTIKVTGNKGEKVSAEMLAGMYDASLDQFKMHNWSPLNIWPTFNNDLSWTKDGFKSVNSSEYDVHETVYINPLPKSYDRLIFLSDSYRDRLYKSETKVQFNMVTSRIANEAEAAAPAVADSAVYIGGNGDAKHMKIPKAGFDDTDGDGVNDANDREPNTPKGNKVDIYGVTIVTGDVQVRKNFNETAFFFPDLKTDAEGNVSFSFTIPESLTQWKFMSLAHTKDLASGYSERTIVTQKPLMVQPNAPRFLREGDKIEFSAKVVNLEERKLNGTVKLELFDAATNQSVDNIFKNFNSENERLFIANRGQSTAVKFSLEIPSNFNSAVMYRIVARSGNFSDGEEMAIPVLTNRMLVTETMPINLRNTNKKDFKFDKLINSSKSSTLTNNALTVEYTSNPAWYAVQSLPYLMEYPYECAEQTFNRYYANALAKHIATSMPKIKEVFERWKNIDTNALMSNLQKNEELKSALLQETPWVLEAQNEAQQKKNIALLFDMVKMSSEASKNIAKLKEMQSSNGGFVWFKGGPDDRYITQYIITGIGHLNKLGVQNDQEAHAIVNAALPYLDKKLKEEYDYLIKHKVNLKQNNLSYTAIQFLYMRSFFPEYRIATNAQTAYTYYRNQAKKYWLSQTKYMQAMIALGLNSMDDKITPRAIIKSLKENAINHEELGMYWKEWTTGGYWWYQAPIESQALMIEAFSEIDKNTATVDDLKTWLLKQKQTQNWRTTKATAEACYALLLNGTNWLAEEKELSIDLGGTVIKSTDASTEAGTGYFKKRIDGDKVKPEMGNITVTVKPSTKDSTSTSWGSVYWQYFEDLDKITSAATPLKLVKKLFVEKNTDRGSELVAIKDGDVIKVGDKIKVRIELKVDRDMEYIHMKDMRAACMEPTNVISEYKWQGGLGYYESTKDASTNFFFNYLNRGSYVFEYSLFVTHNGNYSNGITTIQCMYAPEFSSHSEGVRVNVQ